MATRAATQVAAFNVNNPIPLAPSLHLEIWRLAGGTAGDTSVITPGHGRYIVTAIGDAEASLSTVGTNTNVTFTYSASQSSTSVTFDVWLLIAP